ncbi:trehalose-phosphatase [Acidisoma sp. 7E03]
MTNSPTIAPLDRRTALFLDLDGTLLDIAPRHDAVAVAPGLPEVIARLARSLGGAVAVVTGRPLADVDRLFPALPVAVAAEHGARLRLPDGSLQLHSADLPWRTEWLARLRDALPRWPGAFIEEKSIGFVLHFRQAPQFGEAIGAAMRDMVAEAGGAAELLPALMAFEVRAAGVGKGHAVRHLMAEPPFAGRIPVFIGDDVTDEEGMAEAEAQGGRGLHVARAFGGEPSAVRAWLAAMADRLDEVRV